jgi:hypothetical protein
VIFELFAKFKMIKFVSWSLRLEAAVKFIGD